MISEPWTRRIRHDSGGKGTELAWMARAGIHVLPAFVISTDVFRAFRDGGICDSDKVLAPEWSPMRGAVKVRLLGPRPSRVQRSITIEDI